MEACPRAHRTADVSRGATAHGRTAPQASMVDPRSRICGCRTTSRCAWSVHRWRRRWGRTRDQGMSSMLGAAYEPGIFSSGGYADQPHHHITRISPVCGRLCRPAGRWARGRPGVCVLMVLLLVPAVVLAQTIRWPKAVVALAAERTRAETCGRLLKRHAGGRERFV